MVHHLFNTLKLFHRVNIKSMSFITGSAVELHCKAHSEINRKCKIVTPENFILKLGTCDYVEDVPYYAIFDVDRFSGGFSPNR